MAKLNKQEITAIAEDILIKIQKEGKSEDNDSLYKQWCETFESSEEYKKIKNLFDTVDELNLKFKNQKYSNDFGYEREILINVNCDIHDILQHHFREKYPKKPNVSTKDIERDIIIAQAKNDNIDELIVSIINKYS